MKYLLGIDVGSSSVKCSLVSVETGLCIGAAYSPSSEMQILAPQPGFAEQDPLMWWNELKNAMAMLADECDYKKNDIAAIGISYQMHGLVMLDKDGNALRSSVIWCDSRAVEIGNHAFQQLGESFCLEHYLNSPGNLTASKLKWVKDNQPDIYQKIHKVMLPGDYIAYRLTGEMRTTVSGLSEGVMWDVLDESLASDLLKYYQIDERLICKTVPQFGEQGFLTEKAASELGLVSSIPICYRAGDQPNNAFSLNVLNPGEVAATAGTSGVVYGVIDQPSYDPLSRVNTFVHVNHAADKKRYGVLLCINGTGILNSWLQKNVFNNKPYPEINTLASSVEIGSNGLLCYPFGNGAERVLENKLPGAQMKHLHFNEHSHAHIARAAQEGIVFALYYGMEIMMNMGLTLKTVRAGRSNMFLSNVFAEAFSNTTGAVLELFNTDGAQGAARAAGIGAGIFANEKEAFAGLKILQKVEPQQAIQIQYQESYENWKCNLEL
ncbi:MAG: xylulokinase [Bacteroidota bacterium]|jgi:xylulokinase